MNVGLDESRSSGVRASPSTKRQGRPTCEVVNEDTEMEDMMKLREALQSAASTQFASREQKELTELRARKVR